MPVKVTAKYDPPIFKQGYRITFVRNPEDIIIGVLIEGPRLPRPLYIPRKPGAKLNVKLPEHVKKLLVKEGFEI